MKEIMLNDHYARAEFRHYGDQMWISVTKWPECYHMNIINLSIKDPFSKMRVVERKRLSTINRHVEQYDIKFVEVEA